jgi:predicted transcriptional regulator
MDNEKIVMDALTKAGEPMKATGIAEATGLDKKEVDKVIKKLKKDAKIHSPKNCFYAPV